MATKKTTTRTKTKTQTIFIAIPTNQTWDDYPVTFTGSTAEIAKAQAMEDGFEGEFKYLEVTFTMPEKKSELIKTTKVTIK